jgi:hypothetical protein
MRQQGAVLAGGPRQKIWVFGTRQTYFKSTHDIKVWNSSPHPSQDAATEVVVANQPHHSPLPWLL